MNKIVLTIIFGCFLFGSVSAQEYGAFGELLEDDPPYSIEVTTQSAQNFNNTINRSNFNKGKGKKKEKEEITENRRLMVYKIELLNTKHPLDLNHRIFKLYKAISFNQTPALGFIYYTGTFDSEIDALEYLQRKVLPDFPKAKVVKERNYIK